MIDPEVVVAARRVLGGELAAARRAGGFTQKAFAPHTHYGRSTIANVETGRQNVPREFWQRCDEILTTGGSLLRMHDELDAAVRRGASLTSARPFGLITIFRGADVQRRDFLMTGGTGLVSAALTGVGAGQSQPRAVADAFDQNLTNSGRGLPEITAVAAAAANAKRDYQACRYRSLYTYLPTLIKSLRSAVLGANGSETCAIAAASADVYQVATSLLIKHGDNGVAMLAADRSVSSAMQSGNPAVIGASGRLMVHALMSNGHSRLAVTLAQQYAGRLSVDGEMDPATVAVYGALLLRGAIAAAHAEDRAVSHQLLDEAESAAAGIGAQENLNWTAFGSVNVVLHRIHVATLLGDAGQALDWARHVRPGDVKLPERRASFLIDVASAFGQWGKHDHAYRALLDAEMTAPEEVRVRPSVHHLVDSLAVTAPTSVQGRLRQMAARLMTPA